MKPFVAEPFMSAPIQEQDVLLEVKNLNVYYQTGNVPVRVVNDVSFKLHRGQILGLAGESGSGKSTLVYAITRLLHPPAILSGGETWYYPQPERMLVPANVASQQNHLRGTQRKREVEVDDERLSINVLELSPAELRAFRYPDIIIMDEPTTALDVVVQRDILVELMALREHQSFAVNFITHDLSLLLEIAEQLVIMYAGQIVETAPWQELYRHPHHPYTCGLLNSFPSLHGPKKNRWHVSSITPN